jgi:L-phenylalanine/L-methionine N-acetyltransferase
MTTKIATNEDFDLIFGYYMHPAINPFLLYEPMSKDDFLPIYEDLIARKIVYICYNDHYESVGMFKLFPMPHRNAHIMYLGGVAIHPDFGGQGFGKKMMQTVIEMAKQNGAKRIELSTATVNATAIRLYESIGFEQEGVLRNFTFLKSENRYLDEVVMSYLM